MNEISQRKAKKSTEKLKLRHLELRKDDLIDPPRWLQDFNMEEGLGGLLAALEAAGLFLRTAARLGVIVQKVETRPKHEGGEEHFCTFQVRHLMAIKFYR